MKIIIAIGAIVLSAYLFKKASGTLKPNLINMSSFAFFSIMLFEFIGVTLVFLGFRDHYLIKKISSESIINITYGAMVFVMIALPIVIKLSNKYIYKIEDINEKYMNNITQEISLENKENQNKIFITVIALSAVCFIATIYVFCCIGYVPLFKFLDSTMDFSSERIRISRNFSGNIYIKNIVMLIITPVLSHIAYIYMRTTKEKRWIILFIILFILTIFIKTYNFEKAPIIYYICFFFIIEIMLGNTLKLKKMIPIIVIAITLVAIMYMTVGNYSGNLFSLSNGPIARVIISQAGTLFLHFDAFPDKLSYLLGHSFPPFTKILFGKGEYDIRSGREVMEIYNSKAVEDGTAGVMSTIFIGEAYANFGYFGIIIATLLVGVIFSSILCIYLKSEKKPLNIVLYLECFITFSTVLQAGFIDFFYNIQFIVILIIIFLLKFIVYNLDIANKKIMYKGKTILQIGGKGKGKKDEI